MYGLNKSNLLVAVSALLLSSVKAIIYEFENEELPGDVFKYRMESMYSVFDSPHSNGPESRSYVKVDLDFVRKDEDYPNQDTSVEILFYHVDNLEKIGYTTAEGDKHFCCTQDLVSQKVCDQPYRMIVKGERDEGIYHREVVFGDIGDAVTGVEQFVESFTVERKGVHVLMFASCNELTGNVYMNGHTIWKNPFGYLPASQWGLYVFFGHISITYLLISVAWGYLCLKSWRDLIVLQNYITFVVVLGMLEISLRYFDLEAFNVNGMRQPGLMLLAVIFNSARKIIARMLVLVVSMGYGVVRPSLGDTLFKVMCLGGVYFVCSAVQGVVASASHTRTLGFSQYMLELPIAFLDVLFYYWIFLSLTATMKQLQERRQDVKLALFKRFQVVLVFSVLASTFWSLYYIYVRSNDKNQSAWEQSWILDGFWEALYLAVFVAIMVLWRPGANNQRYAYQQIQHYDRDEDYDSDLEDPAEENELEDGGFGNELVKELDVLPSSVKQT